MSYNPFSLEGKTILVTGASSGIGRSVAIECSKAGAHIVLSGRNEERLKETLSSLYGVESDHQIMKANLSEESEIKEMVKLIPKVDGIVSCAGDNKVLPVQFLSKKDLENIFNVNTFSHIVLVKEMLRGKKINNNSSLVFLSSISGYSNTSQGNALYGSSKGALTSYVKYAALELAGKGIRCNSVHPGRIETPLIQKVNAMMDDVEKDKERYPLKRYGKPEEVAYQVIYLLSDASSWVTGSQFVIDGGLSLI